MIGTSDHEKVVSCVLEHEIYLPVVVAGLDESTNLIRMVLVIFP